MNKIWAFDLDGTLIDSHAPFFKTLKLTFAKYNVDFTKEDESEVLRISAKDRATFFAKKIGESNVPEALEIFESIIAEENQIMTAFDGVSDLLQTLKSNGIRLALWTARDRNSAMVSIRQAGLHHHFEYFVTATCVENCKPHPEGLLRIANYFNEEPTAITMVGDHDNDMNAAKACGAYAVRVSWHAPDLKMDCRLSDKKFYDTKSFLEWITVSKSS